MPMMCCVVLVVAAMLVVGGVSAIATVEEVATAATDEVDNRWGGWQLSSVIYFIPFFSNHHRHLC
jgi:hypothetical protein